MTCKIINHAICVSIKLWDLKIINQYYLKFSLLVDEKEESMPVLVHAIYSREGFMYKKKMEKAKKCTLLRSKVELTAYLYLHILARVGFFYYLKQINAEILFALTSTFFRFFAQEIFILHAYE